MEPPVADHSSPALEAPPAPESSPAQEAKYAPPSAATDSPPRRPQATLQKTVTWSRNLTQESPAPAVFSDGASSPPPSKNTMENVRNVLGGWGKKVGQATKKAEDLAGNMWQHLKTGPSMADAAMGRIAQGTKIIAEGGYEKIFQQTFDTQLEEKLKKSYACYLSTSAGPVMGILYLSTAKLAFCSDTPLSYTVADKTEWSYYKVVIPLHQLRAANSSGGKANRAEKYIQIVSVDNHEFWFMGFLSYDNAVSNIQDALQNAGELV